MHNYARELIAYIVYEQLHTVLMSKQKELAERFGVVGMMVGAGGLLHFDNHRDGKRGVHDLDLSIVGTRNICKVLSTDPMGTYMREITKTLKQTADRSGCKFSKYALAQLPARQQAVSSRNVAPKQYYRFRRTFSVSELLEATRTYGLRIFEPEEIDQIKEYAKALDSKPITTEIQIEMQAFDPIPLLNPFMPGKRTRSNQKLVYKVNEEGSTGQMAGLMKADHRVAFASKLLRCLETPEKRKATDLLDLVSSQFDTRLNLQDPILRKLFIANMVIYKENPAGLQLNTYFDMKDEDVKWAMEDLRSRTSSDSIISPSKTRQYFRILAGVLEEMVGVDRDASGKCSLRFSECEKRFLDMYFNPVHPAQAECKAEVLFEDIANTRQGQKYEYLVRNINEHPLITSQLCRVV